MWTSDMKLAARTLLRRPAFTVMVVATLGLGVGATTAVFGVFCAVFLERLAFPDPGALVFVFEAIVERDSTGEAGEMSCCSPASGPDYLDWVERNRSFTGIAALNPGTSNIMAGDNAEKLYTLRVTPSAFALLGVEPMLGRGLVEEDAVTPGVVVLSHSLWQRLYGGQSSVLGDELVVDGEPRTIVGVMPPDFDVPSPWAGTRTHQLYLPLATARLERNRGGNLYPVLARLAEGSTLESAQADMNRIMRELAAEHPRTLADRGAQVSAAHERLYGDAGRLLLFVMGAAGLVLLIGCGNVAGLQLARASARETELAVRLALGASPRALIRLLFSESVLLAAAGGVIGITLAWLGVDTLKAVLPATIPRIDQVHIDRSTLAFAFAAAAATALAFGVLPAVLASRTDVAAGVRQGGYATLAPRKERVRDYFIVVQIALGLILANGAALLLRSYMELRGQDYGFHNEGVLTIALDPSGPRYDDDNARQQYFERAIERVGAIPGVLSLGIVDALPFGGGLNGNVQIEDWPRRANLDEGPSVFNTAVVGDYFTAAGIPLLRGRTLTATDSTTGAVGVVINETLAEEAWPDEDPIGKRFGFGDPPPWVTVVGVVGDVRQWGPEQPPLAQAYLPYSKAWGGRGRLVIRVASDAMRIVPAIRREVLAVDPTQPPSDIATMDDRLERTFAQRRFITTLISLFAVAALALASLGVYGTVSYFVARRFRELGIRMALGASVARIVGLVLRRGVRLAALGIGIGIVGVWATTSLIESFVYGVAATDLPTLAGGCLVLVAVALAASSLPALRAVRMSPVRALRSE